MEFKSQSRIQEETYNLHKDQIEKQCIMNLLNGLDITKLKTLVNFKVIKATDEGIEPHKREMLSMEKSVEIETTIKFDHSSHLDRFLNRNQRINDLGDVVDTYSYQRKKIPTYIQDLIEALDKEIDTELKNLKV